MFDGLVCQREPRCRVIGLGVSGADKGVAFKRIHYPDNCPFGNRNVYRYIDLTAPRGPSAPNRAHCGVCFILMTNPLRLTVFIDYQNADKCARDAFSPTPNPAEMAI